MIINHLDVTWAAYLLGILISHWVLYRAYLRAIRDHRKVTDDIIEEMRKHRWEIKKKEWGNSG